MVSGKREEAHAVPLAVARQKGRDGSDRPALAVVAVVAQQHDEPDAARDHLVERMRQGERALVEDARRGARIRPTAHRQPPPADLGAVKAVVAFHVVIVGIRDHGDGR